MFRITDDINDKIYVYFAVIFTTSEPTKMFQRKIVELTVRDRFFDSSLRLDSAEKDKVLSRQRVLDIPPKFSLGKKGSFQFKSTVHIYLNRSNQLTTSR